MLIVSDFYDFYDPIMKMGVDRDCVYNRTSKEIPGKYFKYLDIPYNEKLNLNSDISIITTSILLGFCGKIYPLIKVEYINNTNVIDISIHSSIYFYNEEDYTHYLETNGLLQKRRYFFTNIFSKKTISDFFSDTYNKYLPYFKQYDCPIFTMFCDKRTDMLVINPRLCSIDFEKILDPYTAFNEVYMFKAGFLGKKEKENAIIDDKVKAQQHGFDKYSFKTMKGDKKPRNKNRGKTNK